jgi:prepilin peptidase CpaA
MENVMHSLGYIAFLVFPVGMAYAAASDLFSMTISNRISILLLVSFMVLVQFTGVDIQTLTMHAAAGALVLAIGFGCFALGWVGGGDAKLAAVAALWLGWPALLEFLTVSAVLGGGLTLLVLSYRQTVLPQLVVRQRWAARLHEKTEGVPYGIALAAGALLVYPHTPWMNLILY